MEELDGDDPLDVTVDDVSSCDENNPTIHPDKSNARSE